MILEMSVALLICNFFHKRLNKSIVYYFFRIISLEAVTQMARVQLPIWKEMCVGQRVDLGKCVHSCSSMLCYNPS